MLSMETDYKIHVKQIPFNGSSFQSLLHSLYISIYYLQQHNLIPPSFSTQEKIPQSNSLKKVFTLDSVPSLLNSELGMEPSGRRLEKDRNLGLKNLMDGDPQFHSTRKSTVWA